MIQLFMLKVWTDKYEKSQRQSYLNEFRIYVNVLK